jgi:hypothetical protein
MGIGDFFNNTLLSLNTKDQGFSYRKIISLIVLSLTVYLHIHFANKDNVLSFILYDFGFISVLLGLLNLDRFVAMKFGNNGTPSQSTQQGTTLDPSSSQTLDPTGGTQSGS